jgi:hypothetical protein
MGRESAWLIISRVLNDVYKDVEKCMFIMFDGFDLQIEGLSFLVVENDTVGDSENIKIIAHIPQLYDKNYGGGFINLTFLYYADESKGSRKELVSWFKMLLQERRENVKEEQ